MSEQMFNICSQIHVKLSSLLSHFALETLWHKLFLFSLRLCPSMSPAVSLRTGKGIALNLLSCATLLATASRVPAINCEICKAAVRSLIPAAYVSIQRRVSCFPPLYVAQNSQISLLPAVHFGGNFRNCVKVNPCP
jgi:hypothetical protein